MKKIYILIIVVLIIIGVAVFIYFRQSFKEPQFIKIEVIEIKQETSTSAKIKAKALFHNPNSFSATLINTQIKVYSNDVFIAEISQTELTEILAISNFEIPLNFDVNLLNLGLSQGLSGIISQMLNDEKKIPVRFDGYCRIKTKGRLYKIPILYEDEIVFN